MTRALVTQLVEALEKLSDTEQTYAALDKADAVITAAREYLATEPSGERAKLIAELRIRENFAIQSGLSDGVVRVFQDAADILEADAQQAKKKDAELIDVYAKLAEAELRAGRIEAQYKSQCRITESALNELTQQAKQVPMTWQEADAAYGKSRDHYDLVRAVENHHEIYAPK